MVSPQQSQSNPATAFISGPLDITDSYFATHYIPPLTAAAQAGHHFIIGPVRGVDARARDHLLSTLHVAPERINVYMAGFELDARGSFATTLLDDGVGVLEARRADGSDARSTWDRDAAMTRDSEYDILRFRTERECRELYGDGWRPRVSNTERNWRRRRGEQGCEEWEVRYVLHWGPWEEGVDERLGVGGEWCDGECTGHCATAYLPPLLRGKGGIDGHDALQQTT